MRTFVTTISFCLSTFFTIALQGQTAPQWANYGAPLYIGKMAFENDNLWIPTEGGLIKLNQSTHSQEVNLPCNSGIKGLNTNEVFIDKNGVKWIGAGKGGLVRYDGTTWQNYYDIGLTDPLIDIINICQDAQGKLWFLSRETLQCWGCSKLFSFDGNQFTEFPNLAPGSGGYLHAQLSPDDAGNLWVSMPDFLLKIAPDGSYTKFTDTELGLQSDEYLVNIGYSQPENTVYAFTSFYTGSGARIFKFENNGWAATTIPGVTGYTEQTYNDSLGNFWITYLFGNNSTRGFAKFDGNSWSHFAATDLGVNEFVSSSQIDQHGNIWMSTYPGNHPLLRKFQENGLLQSFTPEIFPMETNSMYDVAFDNNGKAWIVGEKISGFDGLNWNNLSNQEIGFTDPGASFIANSIAIDTATGDLLIAYLDADNGVTFSTFNGTQGQTYHLPGASNAYQVLSAGNGKYWVASYEGIYYFDGNWHVYNNSNSPLSADHVYYLALDQQGNIWVNNTSDGTFSFDGNTWTTRGNFQNTGDIFCDQEGKIWVAVNGGFQVFNGTGWISVPVSGISSTTRINSVKQDFDGSFWMSSIGGILHWDGNNNLETFNMQNSPMGNSFSYTIKIDPFGNKWFIHSWGGFTVYNKDGISNQFVNPKARVTGSVYFDTNQNGAWDITTESGIRNQKVMLEPDSITVFTNPFGTYSAWPSAGQHALSFIPAPEYNLTSIPASQTFNFEETDLAGPDFGVWRDQAPDSLNLSAVNGILRCNGTTTLQIQVTNEGFQSANGVVSATIPSGLNIISTYPLADSIVDNEVYWHFAQLNYLNNFLPAITLSGLNTDDAGDLLTFRINAYLTENGTNIQRYSYEITDVVRCSYDPNDKVCHAAGPTAGEYSLFTNPLDFTIRFQNTGNDTALLVVVRDTLSQALDISTFEVLASSHPVRTQLSGDGVVTFIMEGINLVWKSLDEMGSQGFINYRLKPRQGLPDGTVVHNTAHIYFDWNPAIVTNTTSNIIVHTLPASGQAPLPSNTTASWEIMPNPSSGNVWVKLPGDETVLQIMDSTQRLIKSVHLPAGYGKIEQLSPGLYFLKPLHANSCKKLVIMGQ